MVNRRDVSVLLSEQVERFHGKRVVMAWQADERVVRLNEAQVRLGRYVLYWMQASQRVQWNHALSYAVEQANRLSLPVVVGFGLTADYPEANLRHYDFMVRGLKDVAAELNKHGIAFVLHYGQPAEVALSLGRDAAIIVCDCGYLRHQRDWRAQVAREARCLVVQVESDVVVPVEVAADHALSAARSLRPRIHRHVDRFLDRVQLPRVQHDAKNVASQGVELADVDAVLRRLDVDRSVEPVTRLFPSGEREAQRRLRAFIKQRLVDYASHRAKPETNYVSYLAMHLHFGQISPVQIALAVREAGGVPEEDRESFTEELIVRRELTMNFVRYTPNYDAYRCVPGWARATLKDHCQDARPAVYTAQQLEDAATHDAYWNAAMHEMRYTGYMHNYMRMYWGKKIIEWTRTPEHAYRVALRLNNRYFLDGRDPNSFANVAWLFGLHDRPWPERQVFGKVRYMAASGLERKADPEAYVRKVDQTIAKMRGSG